MSARFCITFEDDGTKVEGDDLHELAKEWAIHDNAGVWERLSQRAKDTHIFLAESELVRAYMERDDG